MCVCQNIAVLEDTSCFHLNQAQNTVLFSLFLQKLMHAIASFCAKIRIGKGSTIRMRLAECTVAIDCGLESNYWTVTIIARCKTQDLVSQ